jgi:hypothetical protein
MRQHGNEPTLSKRRRRSAILIPWISHILNNLSIQATMVMFQQLAKQRFG